tara:strand:+ start:151 stop:555 length:405 start_codon:yes stop_codon:yes gene_type:complete
MNIDKSRYFITEVLIILGYEWVNIENDSTKDLYDNIIWKDENNKPTRDEVYNKITELQNIKALELLRKERNKLLVDCDYLAMPDYPHSTDTIKQAWLTYRQALRDLPENSSPQLGNVFESEFTITNVTWPTPPS